MTSLVILCICMFAMGYIIGAYRQSEFRYKQVCRLCKINHWSEKCQK